MIVARHRAPPPGQNIAVGKRVGQWVSELFLTTLAAEGFLVEDVPSPLLWTGGRRLGARR